MLYLDASCPDSSIDGLILTGLGALAMVRIYRRSGNEAALLRALEKVPWSMAAPLVSGVGLFRKRSGSGEPSRGVSKG